MNVTREVITDLLPVYFSGEASADTRALVEAYFQQDAEFARLARQGQLQLTALTASTPAPQQEKETLMRIKQVLRWRAVLLGAALFCSFMPFSLAGSSQQGVVWFMWRDAPVLAGLFAVAALAAWLAYAWTFRLLRDR